MKLKGLNVVSGLNKGLDKARAIYRWVLIGGVVIRHAKACIEEIQTVLDVSQPETYEKPEAPDQAQANEPEST